MQIPKITRVAVVVAALSFVSVPVFAQKADSPAAELDRLLASIASEKNTSVALAQVTALSRLSDFVPRDAYAAKLDAAAKAAKDPQVAFILHRKAAWAFHEMKDVRYGADGMNGPLGQQGCLREWTIAGPFDNPSMEGFRDALGPELGEVGPYAGKLAEVDFRPLPKWDQYCEFNLNQTVRPSTAAVTYLATQIEAPKAQNGVLLLGADGAYKVWLNGKLVAEREEDSGKWVDNDAWKVRLDKGKNELLVKLASTQDGGQGIVARLTDDRLRPLALVSKAAWGRTPTSGGKPQADPRGLLARLKADTKKLRGDARVWAAWLWKSANWQNAAVPWRDVAQAALDAADELDPKMHALLSELFEQHWERRAILEAAAARAPQDPWIATAYAEELENSIADPDLLATRASYEKWAKAGFLPAVLDLSDWYKRSGFDERALAVLANVSHPERLRIPGYVNRLASLERAAGNLKRADDLDAQAARVTYLSGGQVWTDVRKSLVDGKVQEALQLLEEYREYVPGSQYARTRIADILHHQGNLEGAIAVYDELLADVPGDADLYEAKASLQLAGNKREAAIETLRAALRHRPQDQQLRDFVAFLAPSTNRFHEPWMLEDPRQIADKTKPAPFNYDTLIDNSVTFVSRNGLASTVFQRVDRVLNPEGVDAVKAHQAAYQQGDEEVEVLRVRVWKPDGTFSEDHDQWDSGSTRKGSTTYNDTAYVTMQANDVEVGDLVEFRYRVSQVANENFRGDYFGDIAYLQGGRPVAFERYAVIYPKNWELHFRVPKLEHERIENRLPDGSEPQEGFRSTSFELRDVPYVETDPSQPGYTDVYDYLLVSNKKTYNEIGKWWWSLVKEQLIVDEPIRQKVAELTKGLKTEDEKIVAIHNYVVKNTRYLHVGLGIHGWKPYRTSTCFRNRYGDCKDKASLLKVMLEAAGVPANLVLVRTRRLGLVDEYPASMHVFNHAITYVPSRNLFLDGTAEFNGTTELTTMDQGAQALIVQDGGAAKFLTLPIDKPERNLSRTVMEVDLTGEQPVARGTLEAHGANAVYFRQTLEDPERRDEELEKQLSDEFSGAKLLSAKYENLSDLEKPTKIDFAIEGGQILRSNGDRQYVFPVGRPKNLLDAYARQSTRHQDLDIRVPFANETKIRYRLPATKQFESLPRDTSLDSKFGSLDIRYEKTGEELVVDVRYTIDVARVKVEEYQEFRKFLSDVTAALNETVGVVESK